VKDFVMCENCDGADGWWDNGEWVECCCCDGMGGWWVEKPDPALTTEAAPTPGATEERR
jgi:hypothetical protein